MSIETIEGQAMELGWIRDNDCSTSEEDYLLMVLKKTGWYSFIHPARIGALDRPARIGPISMPSIASGTSWAPRSRSRTTCST